MQPLELSAVDLVTAIHRGEVSAVQVAEIEQPASMIIFSSSSPRQLPWTTLWSGPSRPAACRRHMPSGASRLPGLP
jgi:hypothetical protein